jgi:pimeloyl-ACP methyl ester carboxylesterase/DNA-binding winged helix-turn-helix (wHTH) protein
MFAFEGFELDLATYELRRAGVAVPVEPQAFDVLVHLVRHRDRVVAKEELMDEIWGGRFVTETAVTSRIKQVRRVLGDDGQSQRLIRTLHGRGYRFVADVVEGRQTSPAPPSRSHTAAGQTGSAGASGVRAELSSLVRYAMSDGLNIAYQVTGDGELDIVLVPGFVSHLEIDWEDPRHAHFLDRLGRLGRLVRFDKRGTGMSDRPVGLPDVETRMHDVLAVMDAVGSHRAVLLGYSEGGPMSVWFAAAHPERVSRLVVYAGYAKRTRTPDYPWAQTAEDRARYAEYLASTWDWEADMLMRCPSADAAMQAWWGRRVRASTTPATFRALMDMNSLVDVRDALPAVRVPTLVVHRRGDRVVPVENGRYLADHIPGARLVELDGDDHFVSGDPDQILDPVEAFLAGGTEPPAPVLALAAIMAPCEGAPQGLLEVLVAAGGRVRRGPADGPVVLFDGPATAVRAGLRALEHHPAGALGLHVAEVERDAPRIEGQAASRAVAVAGGAPSGSLWATGTVRDLLNGSGLALRAVGEQDAGVEGRQPLFAAVPL